MSKNKKNRKKSAFKRFLGWLTVLCILAVLARIIVFSPVYMKSSAMSPEYDKGSIVIINKLSLFQGIHFEIGDVVYAEFSSGDRLLRRVAAVAGDKLVEMEDGIYLNGENLGICPGLTGGEIPQGAYLLLADDESAADSRTFGLVYKTDIIGTPYKAITLGGLF